MQNYYYRDPQGREIGPINLTTMAKFRSAGVVTADTPIRATDSTEWKPCREIISESQPCSAAAAQPSRPPAKRRNISLLLILVAAAVGVAVYFGHRTDTKPADVGKSADTQVIISRWQQPSAGDAEWVVRDWMKKAFDAFGEEGSRASSIWQLVNIRKKNGQQIELHGFPVYNLEFEGKIKVDRNKLRESILQNTQNLIKLDPTTKIPPMTKEVLDKAVDDVIATKLGRLEGGISGVILFEKIEQGWRPSKAMRIYGPDDTLRQSSEIEGSRLVGAFFRDLQDERQNLRMNCIKQLMLAVAQAAGDNNDVCPDSLEQLIKVYLFNAKCLTDPLSGQPFIYVGRGKVYNSLNSEQVVIIYSPVDDDGRDVAFGNHSFRHVSSEEFARLIK